MLGAPSYAVGWQTPVYLPNPAAGAEWSYTVDGRYYERLISARWRLTTSAAAGDRAPVFRLADADGNVVTSVAAAGLVAPSTVIDINLFPGLSALSTFTATTTWGFMPDMMIPPGWSWSVVTGSLDAADQESGIVLVVQRYPNDAAVMPLNG